VHVVARIDVQRGECAVGAEQRIDLVVQRQEAVREILHAAIDEILVRSDPVQRGAAEVVAGAEGVQLQGLREWFAVIEPTVVRAAGHRLAGNWRIVRHRQAVGGNLLRHRAQVEAEPIERIDLQLHACAARMRAIVAAGRSFADRAIDAGSVLIDQRDAQRGHVLGQRQIHRRVLAVAHAAGLLRMREIETGGRGESAGIGPVGHVLDQATHRARTVQRALRAIEELDAIEIEQRRVEQKSRRGRIHRAAAHRHVVQIHRHRRTGLVAGGHAAHDQLALPAAALAGEEHAGLVGGVVTERTRAGLAQFVGADGIHVHRHFARRLATAVGGDHHFAQRHRLGRRGGSRRGFPAIARRVLHVLRCR
jgi:hypothetical protein